MSGPPPRTRAAGTVLAVVIGIVSAYVIAAWLDCSTAEGVALCLAPVAMPGPLRRLYLSWLLWRLRRAEARVQAIKRRQLLGAANRVAAEDAVLRLRRRARELPLQRTGPRHG